MFNFIRKHLLFFITSFFIIFLIAVVLLPLYKQQLVMFSRQALAILPPEWTIEKTQPDGFPAMGKWMLDNTGQPANWLGIPYNNKELQEPINVIFVDRASASADEATEKLVNALELAGYPSRTGHSTGYQAYIGGNYYPMMPEEINHAFSDNPPEKDNNHGRIFGPYPDDNDNWFFIGAFSREEAAPLKQVKHPFSSFNKAREDVAQQLNNNTSYKIQEYVSMNNAFKNNLFVTTADHDGMTAVLVLKK